jgi:hypothetical protein
MQHEERGEVDLMGYTAPSKKAIKDAVKLMNAELDIAGLDPVLDFWANVQETSLFGAEARVPGENTVVGPDAYTSRKWYATLTVNEHGIVTAIR